LIVILVKINGENQMLNGGSTEDDNNSDVNEMKDINCRTTTQVLFKKLKKGDKRRVNCP